MSLPQLDCPISSLVTGTDIMSSIRLNTTELPSMPPPSKETLAIESSNVSPPIVKEEAAPLDLELSDLFSKVYYLLLDQRFHADRRFQRESHGIPY